MMNLNLKGKKALVCGSSQGIGWASAKELADLGAEVVLMARDERKLKELVKELPGVNHQYLMADFSYPSDVKSAIDNYIAKGNIVHILVNNTGGPAGGPALSANTEDFIKAFNAHLICNQILTQAVVPGMKLAQYGRIINVISTSVKMPIVGLGVSNTIRGAVANWAKTLAYELASFGITVNNVLPGATKTGRLDAIIQNKSSKLGHDIALVEKEMLAEIPVGRFGEPEEIASAIAFLASPSAAYINGINIPIDGGRTGCL